MKVYRETIELKSTEKGVKFFTITEDVANIVKRAQIKDGICVVYSHHTTCSIMIQESSFDIAYNGLEFLQQDLCEMFENILPTCRREGQYMHPGPELTQFAHEHGESKAETLNTDGHLRSALLGRSESIAVIDGVMDLGDYGHIYFVDMDQTRGRERKAQVHVIGE